MITYDIWQGKIAQEIVTGHIPFRGYTEDVKQVLSNWSFWGKVAQSQKDSFPFRMKHNKVKKMRRK